MSCQVLTDETCPAGDCDGSFQCHCQEATAARSETPGASIARTERRRPVLSVTAQLCAALGMGDTDATGSKAVG
jgi:hypothetical protein